MTLALAEIKAEHAAAEHREAVARRLGVTIPARPCIVCTSTTRARTIVKIVLGPPDVCLWACLDADACNAYRDARAAVGAALTAEIEEAAP